MEYVGDHGSNMAGLARIPSDMRISRCSYGGGGKLLLNIYFQKGERESKQQGGSHVHDEVHALNHDTDGKAEVPKTASQGMRQGHRGTGNYLTVVDVEKKMKSNCFGENNERRRASDST
ncbi:hypothetical protein FH972_025349 [Carpinus fangiana]|uniref:Uncharacterized protein n=1 Tax=Carpinus fangiana TaxID=176857 RepID=A0A5N6L0S1_9ROSI|nr:hypothetical protein FH972_025349 [Carpinus fangiana]